MPVLPRRRPALSLGRRPRVTTGALLVAIVAATAAAAGCTNRIGGGRTLDVEDPPTRSDAGVFVPVPDSGVIPPPVDGGPPPTPDSGVEPIENPFVHALVGTKCEASSLAPYVVLADRVISCEDAAGILDGTAAAGAVAFAPLPELSGPGSYTLSAQVCEAPGSCAGASLAVNFSAVQEGVSATLSYTTAVAAGQVQGELTANWCDFDGGGGAAYVSGVQMTEIAIYQGVKIALMQDGQPVNNRNAPVIAGRPALVRVFVAIDNGFDARDVVGRLEVQVPGGAFESYESTVRVAGPSRETAGDSTFNFSIPQGVLQPNAQFSVGLFESAGCGGGDSATARYPATGAAALDPSDAGGDFNVVLVPIRYAADGSNRLPDTSQAQLDRYIDTMFGMFPVPGLNITVREPVTWNNAIQPNGAGWSDVLQALLGLRGDDAPPRETYYYGIFAPAASFGQYCNRGCVSGLGPVPSAGNVQSRGAIGLGFSGQSATETFVHEIGHALGRQHAPCQTNNADPGFPHAGGRLGVWGFDIVTRVLKDPDENRDIMGYCDPTWISDYNFDAVFRRIAIVQGGTPLVSGLGAGEYKVLIDDAFGARWGRTQILDEAPSGALVQVQWLDAAGAVLATDEGVGVPLDHLEGRFVLIPAPPEGAVAVDVDGAGRVAL